MLLVRAPREERVERPVQTPERLKRIAGYAVRAKWYELRETARLR